MKVPIKKYKMNPNLSWKERYYELKNHHKEETEWLIKHATQLEEKIKRLKQKLRNNSGEKHFSSDYYD